MYSSKKFKAHIISHTHWDREWYQTFQQYRRRLVRMMDDLLDVMEKDPEYAYFHLDGQTIILSDYLKIRPENKDRLYKLIKERRILIGPWYVMPDEFLVSGESLIRNLQTGINVCLEAGVRPMNNGYVTDIFGHNSQLPQILKNFGISNATLFRGIGDYKKDLFTFKGADNSEIMCFKLDRDTCYSNYFYTMRHPYQGESWNDEELIEKAIKLVSNSMRNATCDVLLMMDGVDHIDADPQLPGIIRLLNDSFPNVEFIHSTMEDYASAVLEKSPVLETIAGPLYNVAEYGVYNSVLKNVLSSMVQLKQSNDRCEIKLARWAEFLDSAISMVHDNIEINNKYRSMEPRAGFLNEAWETLLENHPHDSICGCSISDVHRDNEYRFRQVEQIADEIIADSLRILSDNIDTTGAGRDGAFIILNGGQTQQDCVSMFELSVPLGHQNSFCFYNSNNEKIPYQILDNRKKNQVVAELRELVRFEPVDILTVAMPVNIPGCGYSSFTYDTNITECEPPYYKKFDLPNRWLGSMRKSPTVIDNGVLEITVNDNGTLKIINKTTGKAYDGILAFEDCADNGDGWNFKKLLFDSEYLSVHHPVEISFECDGPIATVIKIINKIPLPAGIDITGTKRDNKKNVDFLIESRITILKDNPVIQVKTTINNKIPSHRLRVIFPTYIKSDFYHTATPFDMQKWNVSKGDWSDKTETETNVTPSQGITLLSDDKDSISIYTKGLYEVEVVDNESRTVALTLFRAYTNETGTFDRDLPNMFFKMSFDYAIEFGTPKLPCEAMIKGTDWRCGMLTKISSKHDGLLSKHASLIKITGNGVVLSSFVQSQTTYPSVKNFRDCSCGCQRDQYLSDSCNKDKNHDNCFNKGHKQINNFIVRIFNASDNDCDGELDFTIKINEACYVDFLNNKIDDIKVISNKINFKIPPKGIKSIAFNTS